MSPSRNAVLLAGALLAVALLVAAGLVPRVLLHYSLILVAGLAMLDLLWSLCRPDPEVARHIRGTLVQGLARTVTVSIRNRSEHELRLLVHDHHPHSFDCDGQPKVARVAPMRALELQYQLLPRERGAHRFGPVQCRVLSPLRLWWRDRYPYAGETYRVYPNFAAVHDLETVGSEQREARTGVKRLRRRGEGSEFHQLREYRAGDALARIDWRATARSRKLISREYQDERDQCILFLLDCGRRMRSKDGLLSHFDQALNALLLLSHVALKEGDSVGLLTFGGSQTWLPPAKGQSALRRLLNATYALQPDLQMPDYEQAAVQLLRRHGKHALVIVLTNLRDEDGNDVLEAARHLQARHRVLVASLREQALDRALRSLPDEPEEALLVAAARYYDQRRGRALRRLEGHGVLTLDSLPGLLGVHLLRLYRSLKAQGAL